MLETVSIIKCSLRTEPRTENGSVRCIMPAHQKSRTWITALVADMCDITDMD